MIELPDHIDPLAMLEQRLEHLRQKGQITASQALAMATKLEQAKSKRPPKIDPPKPEPPKPKGNPNP
jgi:hypothetical protein